MKKLINPDDECPSYLWPEGKQIILEYPAQQLRPVELHLKPDGDVNDEPSFAFVLKSAEGHAYYAQVSLSKMQAAIAEAAFYRNKKRSGKSESNVE